MGHPASCGPAPAGTEYQQNINIISMGAFIPLCTECDMNLSTVGKTPASFPAKGAPMSHLGSSAFLTPPCLQNPSTAQQRARQHRCPHYSLCAEGSY